MNRLEEEAQEAIYLGPSKNKREHLGFYWEALGGAGRKHLVSGHRLRHVLGEAPAGPNVLNELPAQCPIAGADCQGEGWKEVFLAQPV